MNNNNKSKILSYLCIALFGILGIYFTFISGNTDKYDSKVRAYKISPNESYDSDDGTTYQPTYYYEVEGNKYECKSKVGSSSYPSEKKNIVYYDSQNPTRCKTEYEKSTGKIAGIICLVVAAVSFYFFVIKKPSNNTDTFNQSQEDTEPPYQLDQESIDKVFGIVEKVQLVYKRIIIGIIIVILLVLTLIDTAIFIQTIKARNYIETTATYVEMKEESDSDIFVDYIYAFEDKNGTRQEIIKSLPKDGIVQPELEMTIKYNENNPQDYYNEGATLDKSEMIWYTVKIVALILLIVLFLNKKLLNKINFLVLKK